MERTQGRRLHTTAGAFALGAFLVEHLATNASVLAGSAAYDDVVGSLQRSRFTGVFEIVFILLPLAYHAGYGIRLLARPGLDADMDRYPSRRLWTMQRASATVVFLLVLAHFLELRAQRLFFGMGPEATYTTLTAHLSWTWAGVPWVALLYLLGIAGTCFHFANGLYATWRKRTLSLIVGGGLFMLGFLTVLAFATGTRLFTPADVETIPCGSTVPISSSRP